MTGFVEGIMTSAARPIGASRRKSIPTPAAAERPTLAEEEKSIVERSPQDMVSISAEPAVLESGFSSAVEPRQREIPGPSNRQAAKRTPEGQDSTPWTTPEFTAPHAINQPGQRGQTYEQPKGSQPAHSTAKPQGRDLLQAKGLLAKAEIRRAQPPVASRLWLPTQQRSFEAGSLEETGNQPRPRLPTLVETQQRGKAIAGLNSREAETQETEGKPPAVKIKIRNDFEKGKAFDPPNQIPLSHEKPLPDQPPKRAHLPMPLNRPVPAPILSTVTIQNLEVRVIPPNPPHPAPAAVPQRVAEESEKPQRPAGAWISPARYYLATGLKA